MHDGGMHIAVLGAGSFVAVALLIPLVRSVAIGYGVFDQPGKGKLHTSVTPYLGGVALLITALGASSFLPHWSVQGTGVLVGAVAVGLVGLVDDVRTVGPAKRVAMEVLAATLAFGTGARFYLVNDPVDWLITVGWIVVLTNSFNLLDNMDGAAGVVATTTAVAISIAAVLQGQVLVGGLAAVVAGSCLGFLIYNWHPARIFMGDAGSLFLGFLLASLTLKLRFPVPHSTALLAIVLLVGPALFDTSLVVLTRWRARRPIYIGGTDHTSHRLLRQGLSTDRVLAVFIGATVLSTSLGVALGRNGVPPITALPFLCGAAALLVALVRSPCDDKGVVSRQTPEPGLVHAD